jgi:hypothetical protein
MRALTPPPRDELRRLRHAVAAVIERLRALEHASGDPTIAVEAGCIALSALSTVLFASSASAGPNVPADLVEGEIHRICDLLGLRVDDLAGTACECLSGGLSSEPAPVSP